MGGDTGSPWLDHACRRGAWWSVAGAHLTVTELPQDQSCREMVGVTRMSERAEVAETLSEMRALRESVGAESGRTLAAWAPALHRSAFQPAAQNLAAWLALRARDLAPLQKRLSHLGLSSLGRSDARVLPSLDAVVATLARLAGESEPPPYPPIQTMEAGTQLLRDTKRVLFGADPGGPPTRIMVTLPPEAAHDPTLSARLIEAGADVARINCAHDGPAAWAAMIEHFRKAAREHGRDVRVLMDLAGPKCRTVLIAGAKSRLMRGDAVALVRDLASAPQGLVAATINYPQILAGLEPGDEVSFDDGKLAGRVERAAAGAAIVRIERVRAEGRRLKPEKGVNFPDSELRLDPLGLKDLADLDFVCANADLVGFSFVQRPEDVARLEAEIAKRRAEPLPIVLKIETRLAVRNLPALIVQAGGTAPVAVMIARGDLAVEVGFGRMSEVQEEILWLCEAAQVPVIWATQVLESMLKTGTPSRAEATDAAMGQRAECVMLNKGPYVVEAVRFLDDVLRRMDRHQAKKTTRLARLRSWSEPPQAVPEPVMA
jgi:pyruvate kinase